MKTKHEIIVDVRTPEEWEYDGHANCSVNYPLDELSGKIEELKIRSHRTRLPKWWKSRRGSKTARKCRNQKRRKQRCVAKRIV